MSLVWFNEISPEQKDLGGKAWGLGQLCRLGLPVPEGLVLTAIPNETTWNSILQWWKSIQYAPLAVRSSASAEDSADHSFAGQNQTFLNQRSEADLKAAIKDCFESIHRNASQQYREYFGETESKNARMNVVIQRMVDPTFAGVFFSVDPRKGIHSGWLLEVIEGLGEDLVSGKVTPGQVREDGSTSSLPAGFSIDYAKEIAKKAKTAVEKLGFEVDLEWAIDREGKIQILQARPITTLKENTDKELIAREWERLQTTFSNETTFDGQTFSEWSGFPSYFTFSLWREVFSPNHAFGTALKTLGYASFPKETPSSYSLLDRVFGRAYLNLSELSDLYYGPIPYKIVPKPRPHTVFDSKKINFETIKNFPKAWMSMVRVAWNVSTKRGDWLKRCSEELNRLSEAPHHPDIQKLYESLSVPELQLKLKEKSDFFSKELLHWPLLLVVLTESTIQRMRMVLIQILGEKEADQKIRDYLAHGLKTVTFEMEEAYQSALLHPQERPHFMAIYGHRGPGEMDLKNPRWFELAEKAWRGKSAVKKTEISQDAVEVEIKSLASYKREIVLEEWRLLKRMLELREQWKMEILKPYSEIRLILLELGKKKNIGNLIHWLRVEEVLTQINETSPVSPDLWNEISSRQEKFHAFHSYSFPEITSMQEIDKIIRGDTDLVKDSTLGESLSPGLARGEVRVVMDPEDVNFEQWGDRVILVAETTDPGWTPLFAKASAIVVERGGVLSHCAILAREMGIPAVTGIVGATRQLKDGEMITVDGNQGRIYHS